MGSVNDIRTQIDMSCQAFIRRCIECNDIFGYTIDGEKTKCDCTNVTCLQLCLAGVKDSHGVCDECICKLRVEFKRLRNPVMARQYVQAK